MKLLLVFFISLAFMGCGNEFVPASISESGSANNGSSDDSSGSKEPTPVPRPNPGEDLVFSAQMSSNGIFGSSIEILRYNEQTNSLEIVLPFNFGGIEFEMDKALKKYPDVTIKTSSLDNTLVISLPLKSYLNISRNSTTLPNGRDLPGIPGGEPPSFGFPISRNGSNAYAYLAADYLAIYAETNVKLPLTLRFPIKSNGQIVGYIHLLAPTTQHKGGVFFSVQLPRELTALIESIK